MIYRIDIADRDFVKLDEIQDVASDISWEYTRNGGCGGFSFNVPIKYCRELTLGLNFNVKIYRKNLDTNAYELWYQGRIENKNSVIRGGEEYQTIQGMGYQSALKDVDVNRDYSSTELSAIVTSVLDNDVTPNTDIAYSASDITNTLFTPTTLNFRHIDALSVMQTCADLKGSREWGVDRNRNFFFKARSTTVNFRYPVSKKVLNYYLDATSKELANRVIIIGGETGGSPFTATYNDTTSQLKWGRRDKIIQNSAITTSDVASQFATAQFAEFSDVVRRGRIELLEETLIENTTPLGLFRVIPQLVTYGTMKYGTFLYSGEIDLQINRISYNLDNNGNLRINMDIGQLRPSIAEDISQLSAEIDQLATQNL